MGAAAIDSSKAPSVFRCYHPASSGNDEERGDTAGMGELTTFFCHRTSTQYLHRYTCPPPSVSAGQEHIVFIHGRCTHFYSKGLCQLTTASQKQRI